MLPTGRLASNYYTPLKGDRSGGFSDGVLVFGVWFLEFKSLFDPFGTF